MSRRIPVSARVIAAVGAGLGITLAAFAFLSKQSRGDAAATPAADAAVAAVEQYSLAGLIVKVRLSERADDARLIIAPSVDGKPVTQGVDVRATLTRPLGSPQTLRFVTSGSELVSDQAIAKPHVFDAALDVSWQGKSGVFAFARNDGAVVLSAQQMQTGDIALASAGAGEIVSILQLPGEIRFNDDRTAHVVPRVGGVVERVPVTVGENVAQGQVLAVIASTDLADRRSELLTAERRLAAARVAYEREKSLWRERVSAEQDYLQAQVQLREADIAARSAREKLAALGASASAHALNRYELRAPFAGTIVEKHATAGEAIAADSNIFTISDLSTVWAEMAVSAQQLGAVRVGRQATIKAAAFDSRSTGRITYVGALVGEATRSGSARVVVPNPDGVWRPGMFVDVAVEAGRIAVPLAVANDAVQDIDGAPSVFVESKKGFIAQPVTTGRRDARTVEVVSGLSAGQRFVASNSYLLKAELGKLSASEE
ncbi:RND family efflux transporter MFP subunit [Caballeronia hypogeia]|uniref:RND family efflux transporter MFP subunit n=1 Tax=Caballeronia hypogeia TaxID=1777140 RepID=A0A158A3E1_9BURK|nr:efflux RND transporter periplasmic adaptor subunit [Caballeronia hypogeia]SAK52364.1 RND family efflux transporter MFP subunit [Caballeronia hypogeia]